MYRIIVFVEDTPQCVICATPIYFQTLRALINFTWKWPCRMYIVRCIDFIPYFLYQACVVYQARACPVVIKKITKRHSSNRETCSPSVSMMDNPSMPHMIFVSVVFKSFSQYFRIDSFLYYLKTNFPPRFSCKRAQTIPKYLNIACDHGVRCLCVHELFIR